MFWKNIHPWSPGRTLPPASARSVASDGPVPVREDATYYQQENRNGDTNLVPVPAGGPRAAIGVLMKQKVVLIAFIIWAPLFV